MKLRVVIQCLCYAIAGLSPAFADEIDSNRRNELVKLVRQDCGSCHGLMLKGGLGPSLLPGDLNDKPIEYLKFVILQGRTGTAMPPWKRFLNDAEAQWIAVNLQKGFPDGH
jgi:cytochrome c55X